jgi:hypothetical protein
MFRLRAKSKDSWIIERPPNKGKHFNMFWCFSYLCRNIATGSCLYYLPSPWISCGMARIPIRVVEKVDAPIHWRVRVMCFYSWGSTANLRNYEVRIREKRGMTTFSSVPAFSDKSLQALMFSSVRSTLPFNKSLSFYFLMILAEDCKSLHKFLCRSQWPRGLRSRSTAARLLRSWVRIAQGHGCSSVVCVVCC